MQSRDNNRGIQLLRRFVASFRLSARRDSEKTFSTLPKVFSLFPLLDISFESTYNCSKYLRWVLASSFTVVNFKHIYKPRPTQTKMLIMDTVRYRMLRVLRLVSLFGLQHMTTISHRSSVEIICTSGVPAGKWGILLDPGLRFNTFLIFLIKF